MHGKRSRRIGRPAMAGRMLIGAAAVAFAAGLAAAATSTRRAPLVLNRTVVLQDLGLSAVVMSDAVEQPQPPPTTYTYVRTERGASEKVDLYDPIELWRRTQHAAAWSSPSGASLQLATVSALPPAVSGLPHAELKAVETALRRAEEAGVPSTPQSLSAWLSAFTGDRGASATDVAKRPPRFAELWEASVPGQPRLCGFLFRLNRRYIGLTRAPDRLYGVFLTAPSGWAAADVRDLLLDRFLGAVGPTPGRAVTRPPDGRDATVARMDTTRNPAAGLEESRQRVAESIRNMRGWTYVSTDHFIVLTDLDARRRGLIRDLQARLEALRTAFERLMPPVRPIEEVSVVRVFATSAEYEAYVPPGQRWTGGLWIPARQELVIRPVDDDTRSEQRDRALAAASHEAFHQYIHYALGRSVTPPWFNEGHAELFEPAAIDRAGRVDIPEKPQHVEVLQQLCGRDGANLNLRAFADLSYDGFYASDARQRSAHYALAWGLVYYLRKGAASSRALGAADIIPECVAAVREGQDPAAATARAFARVDVERLRADFADFWSSSRRRREAQRADVFDGTLGK